MTLMAYQEKRKNKPCWWIAWIRLPQPLEKRRSLEKTKLMTNITNGISIDIRINGENLDEVDSFKYLGAVFTDQSSKPKVLYRNAKTTAALARLKTNWNDKHISLSATIILIRPLVISVLLYACETWTLTEIEGH